MRVFSTVACLLLTAGATAVAIDAAKRDASAADRLKLAAEQTELNTRLNQPGTGLVAQEAAAAAPGSPAALAVAAEMQKARDRLTAIAAALAAIPQPSPSQGWLNHLLTDDNGVSLHRLQIAVWTIVFVGVFIVAVWRTFAMPDFDATTLGLMGISSGMYLGFKFPEKAN